MSDGATEMNHETAAGVNYDWTRIADAKRQLNQSFTQMTDALTVIAVDFSQGKRTEPEARQKLEHLVQDTRHHLDQLALTLGVF